MEVLEVQTNTTTGIVPLLKHNQAYLAKLQKDFKPKEEKYYFAEYAGLLQVELGKALDVIAGIKSSLDYLKLESEHSTTGLKAGLEHLHQELAKCHVYQNL